MQLFSSEGHEEEITQGFGWVKGSVKKIKLNNKNLKLPHMCLNYFNIIKKTQVNPIQLAPSKILFIFFDIFFYRHN